MRPSRWSDNRERTLALVVIAASVALVAWAALTRPETPKAPAPAGADARTPTCADVQRRTGSPPMGTCRTSSVVLTAGPQDRPLRVDDVIVEVEEAKLLRATTPSGIRRRRGRVTVGLTIVNGSSRPLALDVAAFSLSVGGRALRANTVDDSRDRLRLERPIAAGARATGAIRFETAGAATTTLARTRRADLGIRFGAERVGVVRLRPRVIAPPAPPATPPGVAAQ